MANLTYLLVDDFTRMAAVIDPTGDTDPILALARMGGLRIVWVLNTHGHADHTSGNPAIVASSGARVAGFSSNRVEQNVVLRDGDRVEVGTLRVEVIHTPGHTPDSVCYLVDGKLFTGDTLFIGECGRTDLPGGDPGKLYDSFFTKLAQLPDETEVYPGHDYGPRRISTLGEERRTNFTLRPRSREEFVSFMREP